MTTSLREELTPKAQLHVWAAVYSVNDQALGDLAIIVQGIIQKSNKELLARVREELLKDVPGETNIMIAMEHNHQRQALKKIEEEL